MSTASTSSDAKRAAPSKLMVLMFTDIVGSVDLKNRIGTSDYAEILSRHDSIFRKLIAATAGAEILTDTGDGFFACFLSASDAVRAALMFQQLVNREAKELKIRIGLHIGEVAQQLAEGSDGKPKVIGLAADFASRLTHLASGAQILMTRFPFNEARQFVRAHPEDASLEMRWIAHGEYLFRGSDEPMEVFEVGVPDFAPLSPPLDNEYARRAVRPGDELTLGWRPANGLEMRNQPQWFIKEKLGEGGFGEVWLAEHAKMHTRRVFKFCFDSHRLRGLKREVVLFRLLKDALGDRRDIARVSDYQFDESPYFIEYEYVAGGSLPKWAAKRGGLDKVPVTMRIEIVARVAGALGAAHSVGVLHKDIKPSNVLIHEDDPDHIHPVLTDFGIGILTDTTQLARHDITALGFTQSALTTNDSSRTGTRLYAPPESLVDRPFTVQGDIYALGVLLYQMTIGDLDRPLAPGWERDIPDEILREDIAECVQGDPKHRLSSAAELARRLNHLDERRQQRQIEQHAQASAARRRQMTRALAALLIVAVALSALLAIALRERSHRTHEAEAARDRLSREMAKTQAVVDFLTDMLGSAAPQQTQGEPLTVRDVLDRAAHRIDPGLMNQPEVEAAVRGSIGQTYATLGAYDKAAPQLETALKLAIANNGPDDVQTSELYEAMASLKQDQGDKAAADELYQHMLKIRREKLGADDPKTISGEINYADLLYEKNDFDGAKKLLQHAIDTSEKQFGADDPRTARAILHMGAIETLIGEYASAETRLKRATQIYQAKLKPGHPDSINAMNELAKLYRSWGKADLAEPLFIKLVELTEKTYGADHPQTGKSLNQIGLFYEETGKYDQAEKAFKRSLDILQKTYPGDHASVAATLNNMGLLYSDWGKLAEAKQYLERAMVMSEKTVGPDEWETGSVVGNLATVYSDLGEYARAEPLFKRALSICEKTFGPDNTNTCVYVNNLGLLYISMQRYDEAEPLLKRAVEVMAKTKGLDHPNTATAMGNLSMLYTRMNRDAEAEKIERQALAIREKSLGPDHPTVALAYNNLAILLDKKKDYSAADAMYQKSIALSERTLGRTHNQVISPMVSRSIALKHAGNFGEAEKVLADAIARSAESKNQPMLVFALSEWIDLLVSTDRRDRAKDELQRYNVEVAKLTDPGLRQRWEKGTAVLQKKIDGQPTTGPTTSPTASPTTNSSTTQPR